MSYAWITIFTVSVSAELYYQPVHKMLVLRPEKKVLLFVYCLLPQSHPLFVGVLCLVLVL